MEDYMRLTEPIPNTKSYSIVMGLYEIEQIYVFDLESK